MANSIKILLVLAVVSKIKCEVENDGEKIVGGQKISITEAPYQGALLYAANFVCGCSIISSKYLLTAAHCVESHRDKLKVRVGATNPYFGGEVFDVEKVIKHLLFNMDTLNYDFAILKLKTEITMKPGEIEVIKLPEANDKIQNGNEVFVSGFGTTNSSPSNDRSLRGVVVPIVPQNICRRSYPSLLTNQMICAGLKEGGKDSCSGDSGGPMKRKKDGLLIGVVSFGTGCALPKYYGVYAKVSAVRNWIKTQTDI